MRWQKTAPLKVTEQHITITEGKKRNELKGALSRGYCR